MKRPHCLRHAYLRLVLPIGRPLDAAYDYLNWWISGWPGAVMARQEPS